MILNTVKHDSGVDLNPTGAVTLGFGSGVYVCGLRVHVSTAPCVCVC